MKRAALTLIAIALLSACSEEKEKPCCAIEPRAKCDGMLSASGVTPEEEKAIKTAGEHLCPSAALSEPRLREIAAMWPPECRDYRAALTLDLDSGACPGFAARPAAPAPDLDLPPGVSAIAMAQCASGLSSRGAKPNEIALMTKPADGICPNNGVSEARIREIIDKDWGPANCKHYSKEEMLKALNAGACGGDAG